MYIFLSPPLALCFLPFAPIAPYSKNVFRIFLKQVVARPPPGAMDGGDPTHAEQKRLSQYRALLVAKKQQLRSAADILTKGVLGLKSACGDSRTHYRELERLGEYFKLEPEVGGVNRGGVSRLAVNLLGDARDYVDPRSAREGRRVMGWGEGGQLLMETGEAAGGGTIALNYSRIALLVRSQLSCTSLFTSRALILHILIHSF
jgi:hypothetical protein